MRFYSLPLASGCQPFSNLAGSQRIPDEVSSAGMAWTQKELTLKPRPRGFHLITAEVLDELQEIRRIGTGLLHVFILHTSASLAINENASPDVRGDLERHFNRTVPENAPYYKRTASTSTSA